ncbi:MAG: barstar family protein [Erysipelotrichaceae bacterium]|nr:barstar family protein [Holdemanella sp.]MCF0114603.1 barstar family protein [Erysipelotrichaceae bacterium]
MKLVKFTVEAFEDRESLHSFLKEALALPDYYGNNLDALADSLYEVQEEVQIVLKRGDLKQISDNVYFYNVLKVLQNAQNEGLNIKIVYR